MENLPADPATETAPETAPKATRREIVKRLRDDSKYLQWLLETWPGAPNEDEILRLKLDLARAINELAK